MKRAVTDARTGEQTIIERAPTQEEIARSALDQVEAQALRDTIAARHARHEAALDVQAGSRDDAMDVTRGEFRALQQTIADLAAMIDPPQR